MDQEAIELELRALQSASFGWAMACSDYRRDDAEDLLQTVYLKIIDGRARFDCKSSFKTWLFGVIRLTAKERYRRILRDKLGLLLFAARPSAFANAPAGEDAFCLRAALKLLPPRQREVLELVFYQDLSIEEAAVAMGVSVGSARTHYERGKQRLRRDLGW